MHSGIRFGIEEEYFITDLVTRQMPRYIPKEAVKKCEELLGEYFAFEMFQGQIEVASPIFTTLSDAGDFLSHARGSLNHALEPYGLGLLSAGSHPLADWRTQQATNQVHFLQLFEDYQRVARRSLLSGLHVHVEVSEHLDRIKVMNEVLPWMPLLLALSSSSPFWEGADSGFMSYRQAACDEWPRMGTPEFLKDQISYNAYVAFLMSTGSIKHPGECWWGVRPSATFPTLELRMTDACPRIEDSLCLASLFRVMIAHALKHPQPGLAYTQKTLWILKENRWRAKRFGIHGEFLVEHSDRPCSIEQWLFLAEEMFGKSAQELGVENVFSLAVQIVRDGTSADRQRHVYQSALRDGRSLHGALSRVVDQLLTETS